MKVLVTGAGGFIGASIVRELIKQGYKVRVLLRRAESAFALNRLEVEIYTGNILEPDTIEDAFIGIDYVFHTAAIYNTTPFYVINPKIIYDTAEAGSRNVCEMALKHGVKKVIYTSSTAAVGKRDDGLPAGEEIELNHLSRRIHYEKAKALAEKAVLQYHDKGLFVVAVNPSFTFGPNEVKPSPTGQFVVKFLNRRFPAYIDGYMQVSDIFSVVDAHIKALEKGRSGERYIIAHEKRYKIKEIFDMLEECSGIPAPKIKLPLSLAFLFSIVNEAVLGITGLARRGVKPILEYEFLKYLTLDCEYDSGKAREELDFKETDFKYVLKEAVRWFMRNGYVKKSSRVKYYKHTGRFKKNFKFGKPSK